MRGRIGRSTYLGEVAEYDFQPGGNGREAALKISELNPRFVETSERGGGHRGSRARGRDRVASVTRPRRTPPCSRNALILIALVAVVGLPFALKPKDSLLADADETLVIVTPHNEAIRYEFARGFRDWYKARTGKIARIDWRVPGGTTEIARYLASEYQAPFEKYVAGRPD